ncbi:MAG: AraC family transcriptional regulator N-terminal domain-containing protein [Egibacteraceae bacterium]
MPSLELPLEERLTAGDVIAEMQGQAPNVGPNESEWPGLTTYQFVRPQAPHWDEVRSLSLCCIVQGRKRVVIDEISYYYDPFHYLVLNRGMRFEAEILEASVERPFLSFVLQIDPTVVRGVSADMAERAMTTFRRPSGLPAAPAYVSPVNQNLMGAVLRFLRSISAGADRRVLAPMYLREIAYRLLQAEQCVRLLAAATSEYEDNPVSEVIRYVRDRMSEPLTVADLADHVRMSPSAFAHLFREVTGMAPYQFVKNMRLDQAGALLLQGGRSVSEVGRDVGYTNLSHFINEFKRRFGTTPGAYAELQRHILALGVSQATTRH